MDLKTTSNNSKKETTYAEIYYNGVGCKFRNYLSEREFREIINKNNKYLNTNNIPKKFYDYFEEAIKNPLNCNLDLLLEYAGAKKLK